MTSVTTTQAVCFAFPDGAEVTIRMPDDAVFVSLAPHVNHTHPCTIHHMPRCQGEPVEVAFAVWAVLADGTVLFEKTRSIGANGFLDLWLPCDQVVLRSSSASGYAAEGVVATNADSPTCITTVRLARGVVSGDVRARHRSAAEGFGSRTAPSGSTLADAPPIT